MEAATLNAATTASAVAWVSVSMPALECHTVMADRLVATAVMADAADAMTAATAGPATMGTTGRLLFAAALMQTTMDVIALEAA